jgi:hypothetical protein
MKVIMVNGLLLSAQAIRFFDDYDEDMNDLVKNAAATSLYSMDPRMSIALQRPDPETKIGKFSFSQALDFSEGKNLDELDKVMTNEYQNQLNKVESHN